MAELRTILFTDIVASVELKREMPGRSDTERDRSFVELVLTPHRLRIESELAAMGGRVVSTAGDGHFLVFSDTVLAARWAINIQRSHREDPIVTPKGHSVSVRISMHLGIPQIDPNDAANFVGKPVDYAARLSDYAESGQILASRSVVAVLEDAGMDDVTFYRHGQRELKGIGPVDVYELVYDGGGPRQMRSQPRDAHARQWTVLPATMGLTEYGSSRKLGSSAKPRAVGSAGTDVVPWRLGNYELEQRLASGGMGDVYRARHTQFDRLRAVKVIKQHLVDAGHHDVVRRFYQEIKAVGALEHPNIVVAIDSSSPDDSVHYLVMEYIEGIGAVDLVARHGPLGVAEACEIARQAARGLAYIHQHGMVHRDIKPSNLMLTLVERVEGWHSQRPGDGRAADGESPGPSRTQGVPPSEKDAVVKILDLGLALLVGEDQQRLTMFDNRPMGTAMYMSPEQWKTTSVDIRADIYSLGCSLYHMLAGKPPYLESDLRPEKAHEMEKLPPWRIAGLTEASYQALWRILERMTAKRPEERFGDPAEVAAALAPFAEGNHLAEVVEQAMEPAAHARTQGVARADTLIATSADSDTRLQHTPLSWSSWKSLPAASRRSARRAFIGLLLVVAAGSIGWLAFSTWQEHTRQGRLVGLQIATNYAASAILGEIHERFVRLNELARDRDLRDWLLALESGSEAEKEPLRKEIESWLGKERSNSANRIQGESWFINDRIGTQIARSPQSNKSTGRVYSHRDYFHGKGKHLPEGTPGLTPIETPHLSAVYRSTSDGTLRVAFSVPIENGRSGDERQVIGVLAMSVDLNDFDVLDRSIPNEYQVALVDLREETIENEKGQEEHGRGLVLHIQERGEPSGGRSSPWIGSELLEQIEKATESANAGTNDVAVLPTYRDAALTGGRKYLGAVKLLVDPRPERDVRNTGWLVLVQQPASGD
jgi:serine/threonine protein kinase/class 3 adenylate cyclase